jgi:RHS repeat-associated protein
VNGVASFLHRDALSSVRAVTGAGGEVTETAVYRPFGEQQERVLDASAAGEDKGFIGERYDADAGLQYLNARYYDPKLGLFLQPDWFEITEPGVGRNRYSYSFNDPVNLSDPTGNAVYRDVDGDGRNEYVGQARDIYGDRADDPTLTYRERTAMFEAYVAANGGSWGHESDAFREFASTQNASEIVSEAPNRQPNRNLRGGLLGALLAIITGAQNQPNRWEYAYHYTSRSGLAGILASQSINPSLRAVRPNDARLGDGVYLTTIDPLSGLTRGQIAGRLFGDPRLVNRVSACVTVNISGLAVARVETTILVPGPNPLYIGDRLAGYGTLP